MRPPLGVKPTGRCGGRRGSPSGSARSTSGRGGAASARPTPVPSAPYSRPIRTSSSRNSARTLTATEGAVLALLAIEGERSGYDLLRRASKAIAHVWSPAKTQLYAVLARLESDGLARGRAVRQASRPDKRLFRITKDGRRALADWLDEVVPGDPQLFFLKAFVGGLMDREKLIEHYQQFATDQRERLEELRAIEPTNTRRGHDYYHYFLLRLGIERAEQSVRWAERALRELREEP